MILVILRSGERFAFDADQYSWSTRITIKDGKDNIAVFAEGAVAGVIKDYKPPATAPETSLTPPRPYRQSRKKAT